MDFVRFETPSGFAGGARNVDWNAGHWAHQPTKLYYNGVTHAEITDCSAVTRNGIDRMFLSI